MIDPITLSIAAGGIIVYDFVKTVGSRLAQRYLPTRYESASAAQVELRREELNLRRQEIAAAEMRFIKGLEEARNLKIQEIERTFQLRREEQDYVRRLQQWPLRGIQPVDFLTASGARSSRALNVILTVIDTHDADFYKRPLDLPSHSAGGLFNLVLDLFHGNPAQALHTVASDFQGDVILYYEVTKSARAHGDSLTSSLWSLLRTEPTVLIEVNVPRPSCITFRVSHWGNAFDPESTWVTRAPQQLKLPGLDFNPSELSKDHLAKAIGQGLEQAESILSVALAALLVSLGDTYRALHRPHELHSPVFPAFSEKTTQPLSWDAIKPILPAYTSAYESIAAHSPLLASELTARAAVTAHHSRQKEFADVLLTKSLELNPAIKGDGELSAKSLAQLRRLRQNNRTPLEIETALRLIRQICADDGVSPGSDRPGSLEDFYRAIGQGRRGKASR